jgi:ABC-type multidrug transport system ATPase subunit
VSSVLRMDSVGIAFDGRDVISGVYFEARAGVVTALVGRNGTGKSTLMKIAAGWIRPDRGFVELGGKRLTARPAELARGGVFHLPVDRTILSRDFTLAQHLDAVEARFGDGDRAAVLDRLAVAHLADQHCGSLSGGEHRRAELSVAMVRRPACLLADEPFRGIPPRDADRISASLREMAAGGCAVVVSGHEMGWVLDLADEVVWLRDATTHSLGPREDAVRDWRFGREYLGRRG